MKKRFLLFLLLPFVLFAQTNENNTSHTSTIKPKEHNKTKSKLTDTHIKAQMQKEKEYAKSQSFAQGDDYNLKEHEIDPNALADVPLIEPEYDFDMDDVYRDDI